jgi:hypothetical protein
MKITNHIWDCENCETILYLSVDPEKPKDREKLTRFQDHVSKHCIEKNHKVLHKEKGDFKYRYV